MCKFYKMLSLNKPNPKAESIERVRRQLAIVLVLPVLNGKPVPYSKP